MQVLMTSTYCGARGNFVAGAIYDLDPDFAEDLIAHGDAEEIEEGSRPVQALKAPKKAKKVKPPATWVGEDVPNEEPEGDM